MFYEDGFYFRCFHSGCMFNNATGWSKGGMIGRRLAELYSLMCGKPDDLAPVNLFRESYIESIEMIKNPQKFASEHE